LLVVYTAPCCYAFHFFQKCSLLEGNNEDVMLFKLEYLAGCTLEGLVFKGEKHNLLVNICKGNRVGQQEKPVGCAARELHQPVFKLIQSLE